jgi:hypothetical protein
MKDIGVEDFHYKSKFPKIPSILFHPLEYSISQTSPKGKNHLKRKLALYGVSVAGSVSCRP